jgi:hypothetical protein
VTKERHWGLRITDRLLRTSHVIDYGTDRTNAIRDTAVTNPLATITMELVTCTVQRTEWETAPVEAAPAPS